MSIGELFVDGIFEQLKSFGPWPPSVPAEIGAVGVIEDGVFIQKTNLASLGIPFESKVESKDTLIDFSSSEGASLTFKAEGELLAGSTLAQGKAGAVVMFSKSGGTVMQAKGVDVVGLADGLAVARAILESFSKGLWDEKWVYVDRVHIAKKTTVLICESQEGRVELEAKAKIADEVPLTAGFSASSRSGAVFMLIGKEGLTPLFHLSRVKKKFFASLFGGEPQGTIVSAKKAAEPDEEIFEEITPRTV